MRFEVILNVFIIFKMAFAFVLILLVVSNLISIFFYSHNSKVLILDTLVLIHPQS